MACALSVPNVWLMLVLGLLVVVPLVGLLFRADDWRKWDDEFWEDLFGEEGSFEATEDESRASRTDALEILRDRYARGELSGPTI